MPFFENCHSFDIKDAAFNDVASNQTINNKTTNNWRNNCNNTTATTIKDSYNDNSSKEVTQGDVRNTNKGSGTFNAVKRDQYNSASSLRPGIRSGHHGTSGPRGHIQNTCNQRQSTELIPEWGDLRHPKSPDHPLRLDLWQICLIAALVIYSFYVLSTPPGQQ